MEEVPPELEEHPSTSTSSASTSNPHPLEDEEEDSDDAIRKIVEGFEYEIGVSGEQINEILDQQDEPIRDLEISYARIYRNHFIPMVDKSQAYLTQYNQLCADTYQQVVLKTVEIDKNGVLRTITNPKDDVDVIDIDDEEESSEDSDESDSETMIVVDSEEEGDEDEAVMELLLSYPEELKMDVSNDNEDTQDEDQSEILQIGEKQTESVSDEKSSVIPTPRVLPRMIPAVGKKVYAMRGSALSHWVPGRVKAILRNSSTSQLEFKIELEHGPPSTSTSTRKGHHGATTRVMSAKHLAFSLKTPFILPVGARVIARFKDELNSNIPHGYDFYAGIVAERPLVTNTNRYLIFFDDGYAQYVGVDHVLWICESSKEVWNDVHPSSQAFIKDYLQKFPERPMVRLNQGTLVSTEWNGNWYIARVVEVDCSLVKMHFEVDNRYEWIYRGSTRLSPLYNQMQRRAFGDAVKENGKDGPSVNGRHLSDPNEPTIEYTYNRQDIPRRGSQTAKKSTSMSPPVFASSSGSSAIQVSSAITRPKIDSSKKPIGVHTSTDLIEYEGRMTRVLIPKDVVGPSKFVLHDCKPFCVRPFKDDDPKNKMINPLALPMYYGWDREVGKSPRRTIFYRAPCGRRIRDYEELHEYLFQTNYNMGIDHFCFDYAVDCFNEFIPTSHHFLIADITYGQERVPVQCCNTIDHDYPEYVEYSKDRAPGTGVKINVDPEFLSCCDCVDDCADKEKCSCWQMTLAGMNMAKASQELNLEVGYQFRRLMDHCITGIYECNPRCQCKNTCLNRVVQKDMKWQLQIFKTSNKGWAIRPIHDIPQGAFICIYAGQLLTEHGANEGGKAFGDEYLAELDYIEVCEAYKEGFETEVVDPELPHSSGTHRRRRSGDSDLCHEDDDKDYITNECDVVILENEGNNPYSLRSPKRRDAGADEDQQTRWGKKSKVSTRDLFGEDEYCYIMDAKSMGNIGRYLNHSCQPNVFVQNVFVDTHDLRFPWVAFFAYKHIRAGTELTWDYNYDIGSVPGKTMYCYCGTPECRGRLL